MDRASEIVDSVTAAGATGKRLAVCGSASKRDWVPASHAGELLSVSEHAGIEDYQPTELVITARAGTAMSEIEQCLAREHQMLAFEPPRYYGMGTFGGAVACGHSGPNRPWGGALRDAVLGVDLVNGRGERLMFGGQVMKNVAGYDVSRLQAGAYGSLGVLLAVSLRVQPLWESRSTTRLELDIAQALKLTRKLARQPLPVTGTCWVEGGLYIRFAGDGSAVQRGQQGVGGDIDPQALLWNSVRDQQHDFFKASRMAQDRGEQALWRVSTPPAAELPECPASDIMIEWGGGLRWVWHDDAEFVINYARKAGGWAWRRGDRLPVPALQRKYMGAIKQAFDPDAVFVSPLDFSDAD